MNDRPRARIAGIGAAVPARVVTNDDLSKVLDTSDEWITSRTGIRERRYASDEETLTVLADRASREAMARAGIGPEAIDAILVGTVSADYRMPSQACYLQAVLGATNASAVDLSAACSGFVYAMAMGEAMIAAGQARTVLVVGGERLTRITDMEDRNTAVLFGDGCGAAVLVPATDGRGILSTFLRADGSLTELLCIPGGGGVRPPSAEMLADRSGFMKMAGREVFKAAVTCMAQACDEALRRAGTTADAIDLLVPHQANVRIIEALAKHAGMPLEKVMVNVDRYGNTSAASIPLALHQAEAEGRLRPGTLALLVAFGGGFTWGSAVVRW
ncbi:MAG: beta-ketoacyl-ACP synthase III [Gemmatimonadales bacterium]|nr:beta-ketoacyl-ACP synthase III [Gemmatimonadales bacterium]